MAHYAQIVDKTARNAVRKALLRPPGDLKRLFLAVDLDSYEQLVEKGISEYFDRMRRKEIPISFVKILPVLVPHDKKHDVENLVTPPPGYRWCKNGKALLDIIATKYFSDFCSVAENRALEFLNPHKIEVTYRALLGLEMSEVEKRKFSELIEDLGCDIDHFRRVHERVVPISS